MFTIVIKRHECGYVGIVKEVPLFGQLQSENSELLAKRFKREIQFLVKDIPDLENADVRVILK